MQFDGDHPFVTFKNNSKKGMVVSKDVGGLTLVASWVRTDSFTHDTDIFIDDEE